MITKTDFQEFFKRRMLECYDYHTLDSYRVRTNNTMTIISELKSLIEGWLDNRIKEFSTVETCKDEFSELIKKDPCLEYYGLLDKELFLSIVNNFIKEQSANKNNKCHLLGQNIISVLSQIYKKNHQLYSVRLLEKIESFLTTTEEFEDSNLIPKLDELDTCISLFGTELLRIGYSNYFLYKYFKRIKENKDALTFEDVFNALKEKFTQKIEEEYTVILKLSFINAQEADNAGKYITEIHDQLSESSMNSLKDYANYITSRNEIRFYENEIKAKDSFSAIMKAITKLNIHFDSLQDIIHDVTFYKTSFTIYSKPNMERIVKKCPITTRNYTQKSTNSLATVLSYIEGKLDKTANIRLTAALRHLRHGDTQMPIEQRFINYWIAFEFLFASPKSNETTFKRLKDNLPRIFYCCYLKRNINYLNKYLEDKGIALDKSFGQLTDDEKDELIKPETDILTKYRIRKMKSILIQKERYIAYMKNHKTNITNHLIRIYRLRNELIHEAAIKQDIVNITTNLRYYLTFILCQIIYYAENSPNNDIPITIDRLFWEYEIIEARINRDKELNIILDVPLGQLLI